MTVRIDIDLKAKDAFVKLAMLEKRFGQLDDRVGKIGNNLELSIGDEIQSLVDDLEDLDNKLDDLGGNLGSAHDGGGGMQAAAANAPGATDGGIPGTNRGSDNDRGSGILGRDPDLPNATVMARRIEDRFGLDARSLDADVLDGMEIKEVRANIAEFIDHNNGTNYGNRGLMTMNAPDTLLPDDDGTFLDDIIGSEEDKSLKEQMTDNFSYLSLLGKERRRFSAGNVDFDTASSAVRGMTPNVTRLRSGMKDKLPSVLRGVDAGFQKLSGTLRRLKPNMRKIWNFIALMLPLLIAFGTQALGVAAAMGAVATAGAALVAGGLLGHADSMGESFQQAKYQLRDLKSELFEQFQPTFQQFAPISEDFLEFAPSQLGKVATAMEGLTAYEGVLFEAFSGFSEWVASAVQGMVDSEDAASQLAMRFGSILGTGIIDFFGWLLVEARQNQEMLISLGEALYDIAVIIYRVTLAIARFATILAPFLGFLRQLSALLSNKLVMGLIAFAMGFMVTLKVMTAFITKGYMMVKVLQKVYLTLLLLGKGSALNGLMYGLGMLAGMMDFVIAKFMAMSTAAQIAAASIAAATLGASLLIGGAAASAAMSNSPGSGGQKVVNDNREININGSGDDFSSQQKIVDTINQQDTVDGLTTSGTSGGFRTNTAGGDM